MTQQAAALEKSSLNNELKMMANALRVLSMDAVEKAQSGHPGMPMGMADVATVLYSRYMKFNPKDPLWPDRDRFILSAGHGSMLLYSILNLTRYDKMEMAQIERFRQLGSLTPGHPEVMQEVGIETTTGPLGQGISNAVGFAMAERILNAHFTDDLVDHKTYVIASDGDLMEGISHEACALAGHLKLSKLIVLYDQNGITIDGETSLSYSDDVRKRFEAYGWYAQEIDGHDYEQIDAALANAQTSDVPSIICCRTRIGFGAPEKEGSSSSHGAPLGEKEIAGAREFYGWTHEPFMIPVEVSELWQYVGERGLDDYNAWQGRLKGNRYRDLFEKVMSGDVKEDLQPLIAKIKKEFAEERKATATRKTSGKVLETLVPAMPFLIGGSADLTGSNNTKVKGPRDISAEDFGGQYIYYGVREHGMAAAMNGMALHGGVIPYSGTFLTFSDYCRPSLRLAGLMKQRVIHVMTHDSIGLGEDGPTHQPVEHLAALRAIPNLYVMRPCDGIETAECWQIALESENTPTVMALTRQNLPSLRDNTESNLSARGAYVLQDAVDDNPQATIFASGSEVHIALEASQILKGDGISARVVSVPCMDLFFEQDGEYIQSLICNDSIKVAVEAGIRQCWDALIGPHGSFVGMKGFGESAPYEELYKHFGITKEAIVDAVKAKL